MKKLMLLTMSVAVLASTGIFSNAYAQEKTRAEVRQELVQAENNGQRFVTDTSYPEVNPIFAQQAAKLRQQNDTGVGAVMSGASGSGGMAAMRGTTGGESCVGPVSFCTPFFGS